MLQLKINSKIKTKQKNVLDIYKLNPEDLSFVMQEVDFIAKYRWRQIFKVPQLRKQKLFLCNFTFRLYQMAISTSPLTSLYGVYINSSWPLRAAPGRHFTLLQYLINKQINVKFLSSGKYSDKVPLYINFPRRKYFKLPYL